MSHNTGFAPIARKDARILILGSMPSEKSLQQQQYYAHPRNAFWPIICRLFNAPLDLSYSQKQQLLMENRIALWDVLHSCFRSGSLDSAIDPTTANCNDFKSFLQQYPQIEHVFFNGAKAEQLFRCQVLKELDAQYLSYQRLPSTSPANAALSMEKKLAKWKEALALKQQS
ncbi:MAG: DNA-deoxyinosine glycosylase [Gammaproteobacteria bacterium]